MSISPFSFMFFCFKHFVAVFTLLILFNTPVSFWYSPLLWILSYQKILVERPQLPFANVPFSVSYFQPNYIIIFKVSLSDESCSRISPLLPYSRTNFCLLFGVFKSFTFKVIIDKSYVICLDFLFVPLSLPFFLPSCEFLDFFLNCSFISLWYFFCNFYLFVCVYIW